MRWKIWIVVMVLAVLLTWNCNKEGEAPHGNADQDSGGHDMGSQVNEQDTEIGMDSRVDNDGQVADTSSQQLEDMGPADTGIDGGSDLVVLNGGAQKGPFIAGSAVDVFYIVPGDRDLNIIDVLPTITDTLGRFDIRVPDGWVKLRATGFMFRELDGQLSGSQMTLYGFGIVGEQFQTLNLNVITHLTYNRVEYLVREEGMDLEAAMVQAESELRTALGIIYPGDNPGLGNSADILGEDNADNEYLLAVGCIISKAAWIASRTMTEWDGRTQWLLDRVEEDLADDGDISQDFKDAIQEAQRQLLPAACTMHLAQWKLENGLEGTAPDVQQVLDSDGDDIPNASDVEETPGMVTVPAGMFAMGTDDGAACYGGWRYYALTPLRLLWLPDFQIDLEEATVADYTACVDAQVCGAPEAGEGCNYGEGGRELHPINCLSYDQAETFCEWQEKRLPTVPEWQKAARGGCELYLDCQANTPSYPWGNDSPTCDLAVIREGLLGDGCGEGQTWPVGSKMGNSPYGLRDEVGNVAEWVFGDYDGGWTPGCDEHYWMGWGWESALTYDAWPYLQAYCLWGARNTEANQPSSASMGVRCAQGEALPPEPEERHNRCSPPPPEE